MDPVKSEGFRINNLPPYVQGEIAQAVVEARVSGRDIIDLSQLNPTLDPPGAAVEKLVQNSLLPHNHRYSASQGISKLRRAISEFYQNRFEVDLDPNSEVVATMGTKEGIAHLLLAAGYPGDTILVPTPTYPVHKAAVFIAGAGFVGLPICSGDEEVQLLTEESEGFFQRLASLYSHTWPRPKLMVLSFPHNPTTVVVSRGFFQRLVDFARDKGLLLVHDFAYADICFDDYRAPSILEAEGAREVAVECYSLSKGLGMPGWRIGFCVGNREVVSALKKIKSYLDFGIFQPLQIAASDVLLHPEAVLRETVSVYQSRRDVLVDGLGRIGWRVNRPKASVFVWARIPDSFGVCVGSGESRSLAFGRQLLSKANVAVSPGRGFDWEADDYVRFALVENEQRLRMAVNRIAELREA